MAAVTSCEYAQYVDWQKNAKARGKGWKRFHCSSRFAQSDRAIKELKQWRRRRQRERQKSNRFRLAKQQHLHVHHAFLCISFPSLHDYNVKMPNFTFWRGRENTRQRLSYSFLELRCSLLEFKSRKNCQHLTNRTRWNKCYKVCSSATSLFERRFLSRRCRCCVRVSIIISASSRKSRDLTVRVSVLLYRLIALGDDGRESTLQRRSFLFSFFFFFAKIKHSISSYIILNTKKVEKLSRENA